MPAPLGEQVRDKMIAAHAAEYAKSDAAAASNAKSSGLHRLHAAVKTRHPAPKPQEKHPATKNTPKHVVARHQLHAPGKPPLGTSDKMLKPLTYGATMTGHAKAKTARKKIKPAPKRHAIASKSAPAASMHGMEFHITVKVKRAKGMKPEQESAAEDAGESGEET